MHNSPLKWFFDNRMDGETIGDVAEHLLDVYESLHTRYSDERNGFSDFAYEYWDKGLRKWFITNAYNEAFEEHLLHLGGVTLQTIGVEYAFELTQTYRKSLEMIVALEKGE